MHCIAALVFAFVYVTHTRAAFNTHTRFHLYVRLTEETRALGLVVCRGTQVMVIAPVNGTEVYAARNAKVQAQVEKEAAEAAAKAAEAADAEDDAVPPAADEKPVE